MASLQLQRSSSTPIFLPNLKNLKQTPTRLTLQSRHTHKPSFQTRQSSFKPSPLVSLEPFIRSQWKPVLQGWSCSLLSAYSVSALVPKFGLFSATVARSRDAIRLRDEGLVLGILFLVRVVSSYWQQAFLWEAALNLLCELRVSVFRTVLQQDLAFFEGGDGVLAGDIAYRISAEAENVADAVYSLLNAVVPSTLHLCVMATQMIVISPVLSFISALVIPCTALFMMHLGEQLRRISRKAQLSIANISAYLNEGVEKAYNEWKQAEPAIERLFDLTRLKSKVVEKPDAVNLDCVLGELKFCNISFRYGDNLPLVLDGLNLHIAAGETVALVGPSGGGKTTLVKLLLRLYDPLHGHILIDNQNIQNICLGCLRRHVGLVSQDIMLFSGTVAENIGYRDLMGSIDMERVEHAAKSAYLDDFIRSLPQGYATNIGPRGSRLSGGQKQRLAIARALYQDSFILILDEATSALDSTSELLVRQSVERLMKTHTVLVIAHRLETLQMANRVFLLNGGKLRELDRDSLLDGFCGLSQGTGLVI